MAERTSRQQAVLTKLTVSMLVTLLALIGCTVNRAGTSGKFPNHVTIVVPFSAGGGGDLWARAVAPYLQQHLPGKPRVEVKDQAGGAGVPASNEFVDSAPSDGSTVLQTGGSSWVPWLLGSSDVHYDFRKLKPAFVQAVGGVFYTNKASGVTSVDQLTNGGLSLRYGGESPTGQDIAQLLAFNLLKLHVKTTFGFSGRGEVATAMQRNDKLTIDFQTYPAYRSQVVPQVNEGKAFPLMQLGMVDDTGKLVRDPNFPDLPTVAEVYKKLYGRTPAGAAYDAYVAAVNAAFTHQKGLWLKPDTPKSVTDAYFKAAQEMIKDPKFKKDIVESAGTYPLTPGNVIVKHQSKLFGLSDSSKAFIREMLATKYNTKVS